MDRRTTWNPGIPGGIPNRSTVCATVNAASYGNGSTDATAGIQAAINACPNGQVVQLGAGTFKILTPIRVNKSITLRGAGPTQTHLKMPDGTGQAVVVLGVQWIHPGTSLALTADAAKGARAVSLSSASALAVGELVEIDALTDPNVTVWSKRSPAGDSSRGWFSRQDRPISQMLEVESVSGNTVTFTTPFHTKFEVARSAQVTRFPGAVVRNAGLEDLHVYGGEGGDGGGNVRLEFTAYSWVKNIDSQFSNGGSIAVWTTLRSVIRDSYFHETKSPNPGGAGYGISLNFGSADNLIENNISWNFNKVMVMRATGGGNVIGYNYFEDGYGAGYPDFVEAGMNGSHMTTPHFELFEGNEAFNISADGVWGNSVYLTFFRNHSTAARRSLGGLVLRDLQNRNAVGLAPGHYWYSFIGNVLGSPGMSPAPAGTSFRYENNQSPWNQNPVPMWQLGYDTETWGPADPKVLQTAIRDGNFDYVSNQVHWDNTARTLPASLYLSGKPAFFGTNPWPWVDPTGSTKLYVLPARQRFDALKL